MGLAPLIVEAIFDIIEQIRSSGATILLVEQNAAQALELADRGYVLENGSIVMTDQASILLDDDRVRRAYLGEGAGLIHRRTSSICAKRPKRRASGFGTGSPAQSTW